MTSPIQDLQHLLPIYEIGEESAKEKKGRSDIFTLHFWWARKPLISSRAAILSTSLSEPVPKKIMLQMLGLGKRRAYNQGFQEWMEVLREHYSRTYQTDQPTLLDPFAGGGSIGYEALRMGFNVVTGDYNPVAHIIQLGTLYYPKLYPEDLPNRLDEALTMLRESLENLTSHLYPQSNGEEVITYMYAWGITCPYCGFLTPAVNNWMLKKKPKRGSKMVEWVYMVPEIIDGKFVVSIHDEIAEHPKKLVEGTSRRGHVDCINCFSVISNQLVVNDIYSNSREIPLCKVVSNPSVRGKQYRILDSADLDTIRSWDDLEINLKYVPEGVMREKVIASARYLGEWKKLLNPRQQFLYSNFVSESIRISNDFEERYGNPWGRIIATYLAMLLGKSIDFNNRGTSWASKEGIRNSLAFRRPSMAWNHCETNILASTGSGTLSSLAKFLSNGVRVACTQLAESPGSIKVVYSSVFDLDVPSVDAIVTDPPYGDDVQYSELSEFFYVWEYLILREFYDYLPSEIPTEDDLSVNNEDRDNEFAKFALSKALVHLNGLLKSSGRLSMFFAHGKLDTWSYVIEALRKGRFQIKSTLPLHTESKDNVIALGKASFMTSVVMFCEKRQSEVSSALLEDIEDEIIAEIESSLPAFMSYGLKESDLAMVALGPALKMLTEYAELKSIRGDLNIERVLEITSRPLMKYLTGLSIESNVDPPTKLFMYLKASSLEKISYDMLQILSKSLHIPLEEVKKSGVVHILSGKKNKLYSLATYKDSIRPKENTLIGKIFVAFDKYDTNKLSSELFWEMFKDDQETVRHVLEILRMGKVGNKQVRKNIDRASVIARELLN